MSTVNLGIAGMDPRTEQMLTREQYDRTVRSEATPGVAGMPVGTTFAERAPAVAGDPGACLKLLKSLLPHGLAKSEPVAVETKPEPTRQLSPNERITGPTHVTALIKAAHGDPGSWDPFAADQNVAKLLQATVGFGERGELFTENGCTLVRVSKAA